MRKSQFALLFAVPLILFCYIDVFAATTYYISYSAGSNSNNGTSKTAPWKTHPWMPTAASCTGTGFSPSYTHHAGDQFIFEGGDSWPAACWPMTLTGGGTGSQPDYYGADETWFDTGCGSLFCRPIFDAQTSFPGSHGTLVNGRTNGVSYITFDNWEIRNFFWSGATQTSAMDSSNYAILDFNNGGTNNITIQNFYIHHWTHGTLASGTGDALKIYQFYGGGGSHQSSVMGQFLNNTIDNSDGSGDSGILAYGGVGHKVDGNLIKAMPNIVIGNNDIFSNNLIIDMNNSFDDADTPGCVICTHENGYEAWSDTPNGVQYIFNNIMHDTASHGFPWDLDPEFGAGTATVFFFNNVTWNTPWGQSIVVDTNCNNSYQCKPSLSVYHLWNNTAAPAGGVACIRVVNRGVDGNVVGVLDIQNMHCVSDAGSGLTGLISIDSGETITNYTHSPLVVQSTSIANGQGYQISNSWRPSSGGATVGSGTNLSGLCSGDLTSFCADPSGVWNMAGTGIGTGADISRPSGSTAWDVGAYEFSSGDPPPAPPTKLGAVVK